MCLERLPCILIKRRFTKSLVITDLLIYGCLWWRIVKFVDRKIVLHFWNLKSFLVKREIVRGVELKNCKTCHLEKKICSNISYFMFSIQCTFLQPTYHLTHSGCGTLFMTFANYYMFRQRSAFLREFIKTKIYIR